MKLLLNYTALSLKKNQTNKQTNIFLQFSFSAFSDRHFMTLRCMCPYFQDELDFKSMI